MLPLALGADHIGYDLKEAVKTYLSERGVPFHDHGTHSRDRTDYPLFAEAVARAVQAGTAAGGLLICGTGVGMAIAANKLPGIRAVVCSEPYSAALSRQHNDSNVLTFGAQVVGPGLARLIVAAWLDAQYEGGRHAPRLAMIARLEAEAARTEARNPEAAR
jgi:ribose 5-phosphate isomerase B